MSWLQAMASLSWEKAMSEGVVAREKKKVSSSGSFSTWGCISHIDTVVSAEGVGWCGMCVGGIRGAGREVTEIKQVH